MFVPSTCEFIVDVPRLGTGSPVSSSGLKFGYLMTTKRPVAFRICDGRELISRARSSFGRAAVLTLCQSCSQICPDLGGQPSHQNRSCQDRYSVFKSYAAPTLEIASPSRLCNCLPVVVGYHMDPSYSILATDQPRKYSKESWLYTRRNSPPCLEKVCYIVKGMQSIQYFDQRGTEASALRSPNGID